MAGTRAGKPRTNVQAYVRQSISQEFILRWRKLRDANDKLNNVLTVWCRAYAEHCANVYDEEQEAIRIDQAQHTQKHVKGLWAMLEIEDKVTRSKIRVTGRWFKALPAHDRELILTQIPATKEALYLAASHDGAALKGVLKSQAIGPESTTAQFRARLDKPTPQDRTRNAKRSTVPVLTQSKRSPEKPGGPLRITVTCQTRKAATALIAFVESHSTAYSIEAPPTQTDL
jgi:hypothetical protein